MRCNILLSRISARREIWSSANGERQKCHVTMFILHLPLTVSSFSVKLSRCPLTSKVRIILHYSHLYNRFFLRKYQREFHFCRFPLTWTVALTWLSGLYVPMTPRAMAAGVFTPLVGPPKPERSRSRVQTKVPTALQVWGLGLRLTTSSCKKELIRKQQRKQPTTCTQTFQDLRTAWLPVLKAIGKQLAWSRKY